MRNKLEKVMRIIDSVEGYCKSPQPQILYNLSKSLKGTGEIVEIGTFAGKSAIALAYAQKENNGKKVYTIDIKEHINLEENLKNASVFDWVIRIVSKSYRVGQKWNKPVELLWIDGAHNFAAVEKDIKMWAEKIVEGGYIALHDYPGAVPGKDYDCIHRAVYRRLFSEPRQWKVVSDRAGNGNIIIFEKIKLQKMGKLSFLERLRYLIKDLLFYLNYLVGK